VRLPGAWFRALAGITAYWGVVSLVLELHKRQPFDVIHSHFIYPNGIAGRYLGRRLQLPTVCSVRGNDILTEPFENPINKYFAKQVIEKTQQIVTVSRALKQHVEQFAKPARPVKVVYNGVDVDKFQAATLSEPVQVKIKSLKPYLLFVGQDIRRKGLRDLLDAFARLTKKIDHKLVIIGPLPAEVGQLAPVLFEELKNRVVITGPLSPDEVPGYMQHCQLLALPSYEEGLPNAVLEAMACEKPVVATNITGIPEAVLNNITGILVPPGSPAQLAEAIKSLINNPELGREMGKQGREHVLNQFSWEHHTSEMVSVYESVITEQVSRHAPG